MARPSIRTTCSTSWRRHGGRSMPTSGCISCSHRGASPGSHYGWASARRRPALATWWPLLLALACGPLVAMPQLVELLRILPTSTRGVRGYDAAARTLGSWDPRQALEQLVPLAFGRLDRTGEGAFWGYR